MFVREKQIGAYRYVYLVESVRENGRTKQRIVKNLGRKEQVAARGDLDRLARSAARLAQRSMILSLIDEGSVPTLANRRIGPALAFERLWRETGCRAVIEALAAERGFGFALERACFLTVLHRLMVSGSDRAADAWREDYRIDGTEELALHQLYRTMAWLGEELPGAAQAGRTPFAPRCVKDLIEEGLFEARRDLFSELSVVFMDTTSLYFEGAGGATLGQRGHSKDHRPDLMQMIVAVVMDQRGRPLCCEMWPGNTTDVTVLIPVVDRLGQRFGITRVCVVADRGMISAQTIAALEKRGLEHILGVRERSTKEVRTLVLDDDAPFVSLVIPRQGRPDTELEAKAVTLDGRRYIVCRNLAEATRDAAERDAIVANLRQALRRGDKALIGNAGYRRFLKAPELGFAIDDKRVAEDARFDGIFVLRTNTTLDPLQAMLRYRELQGVEQVFRSAKSLLATRPIFHKCDATIRGHVFCSFLALALQKELADRCAAQGFQPEWDDVRRDLDRLQEVEVEQDGKRFVLRTPTTGCAGKLFQTLGVALPPNIRAAEIQASVTAAEPAQL
ncbi:MAG: IS1634 family transposase [Burkholderiales bacterium]